MCLQPLHFPASYTSYHQTVQSPNPGLIVLRCMILDHTQQRPAAIITEQLVLYDYKAGKKWANLPRWLITTLHVEFSKQRLDYWKWDHRMKEVEEILVSLERGSWMAKGAVEDMGGTEQQGSDSASGVAERKEEMGNLIESDPRYGSSTAGEKTKDMKGIDDSGAEDTSIGGVEGTKVALEDSTSEAEEKAEDAQEKSRTAEQAKTVWRKNFAVSRGIINARGGNAFVIRKLVVPYSQTSESNKMVADTIGTIKSNDHKEVIRTDPQEEQAAALHNVVSEKRITEENIDISPSTKDKPDPTRPETPVCKRDIIRNTTGRRTYLARVRRRASKTATSSFAIRKVPLKLHPWKYLSRTPQAILRPIPSGTRNTEVEKRARKSKAENIGKDDRAKTETRKKERHQMFDSEDFMALIERARELSEGGGERVRGE